MGLDVSHNCWAGSYSTFTHFRNALAAAAGHDSWRPTWPAEDPLILLLDHSDCDGFIHHSLCEPIANRLEELIPQLEEHWADRARQFANGLRSAAVLREHAEFF